jgi:hypothetical protein
MDIGHIHHIHPHSLFPCAHPLPLVAIPGKRFIFPFCPSFFSDSPREFCLGTSALHVSCLYQMNSFPSATYSFFITMLPQYSRADLLYSALFNDPQFLNPQSVGYISQIKSY